MGRKRILRLGKGWFGSGKEESCKGGDVDGSKKHFRLGIEELENRLEVESVPRILACTSLHCI